MFHTVPSRRKAVALHLFLLSALGALVYSNSFGVPFQFDDIPNIVSNPVVRDPFSPAPLEPWLRTASASRYLGYLSFAMNYRLGGLDTAGYHAVNLLAHLGCGMLLYAVVLLMFRLPRMRASALAPRAHWIAFFTGLFFVAHPLATQAVTFIVQRLASLCTLFYLGAVACYLAARGTSGSARRSLWYALALAGAVAAVKTKEIAVTIPLALAVCEIAVMGPDSWRARLRRLAPFVLVSLLVPLSLWMSTDGGAAERLSSITRDQSVLSRTAYLMTEVSVILTYLRLLLLPINQTLEYDYPVFPSIPGAWTVISLVVVVSLIGVFIALVRASRRRDPALALAGFGGLWFFLALLPESSLFPIVDVIFEHRTYLPLAGASIALVTGAALIAERVGARPGRAVTLLVMLVLVLALAAHERNLIWRTPETLWRDAARKAPLKARPRMNLGTIYGELGLPAEARREYHAPMRMTFTRAEEYNDVGVAFARAGRLDEAARMYREALALKPGYADALGNLGAALAAMGELDEAEDKLFEALRAAPDAADVRASLGSLFLLRGDLARAEGFHREALSLSPDHIEARYNLILTLRRAGRHEEAERELATLRSLSPALASRLDAAAPSGPLSPAR